MTPGRLFVFITEPGQRGLAAVSSLQNARAPSGLGNYIKGSADGDVVHHGINLDVFPSIPPSLYMVYKVNPPLIMAKSERGLVGHILHPHKYSSM